MKVPKSVRNLGKNHPMFARPETIIKTFIVLDEYQNTELKKVSVDFV